MMTSCSGHIKKSAPFDSSIGEDVVEVAVIDALPDILNKFGIAGGVSIHDALRRRHRRQDGLQLPDAFVVGDFWPPSVLVGK
jgi:hypothetical protein